MIFHALRERIILATLKHPDPQNVAVRYDALRQEVAELYAEIENDAKGPIYNEALDVATVALRIAAQATDRDLFTEASRNTAFELASNLRDVQERCSEQLEEIRNLKEALSKEKAAREALQRTVAMLAVEQLQGGAT